MSLTERSPRVPCSRPLVSFPRAECFQYEKPPCSVTLVSHLPLSTDLRGPRQLLQRGGLFTVCGLRLPLPLPHPDHTTVPAVQCGPVYSQSSGQVRGEPSKHTRQAAPVAALGLALVTTATTSVLSQDVLPLGPLSWLWLVKGT